MNLAKTPLSIRKERELADLKAQLKKIRTQLKRNTTILKNLKEGISTLQQDLANGMLEKQEEMKVLQEELLELLKKIMASKEVDEDSREQAKMFFEELQDLKTPDMEDFDEEDFEGRGGRQAFFEQFRVAPPKTEQRNIRKIFLKLAAKFHPDKARTEEEANHFHKIMQQINTAYERNDILTLLDMEAKYADYQSDIAADTEIDESAIISLLDQEIEKINNEVLLLQGQLSRVKQEVKELRASDAGEMHKEAKRVKKHGVDFVDSMKDEMEMGIRQLKAIKELMEELLKTGTITNEMMMKAGLMPSLSMLFDDDYYYDEDNEDEDDYYDDESDFSENMSAEDLQKAIMNMFGL